MKSKYYDGTKLLSLKDLNGNTPEIYICTSNRSAGKTTYFSRLLVKRFKESKRKFTLLYRYNYELDDCADKFFRDIKGLFFHDDEMESNRKARGIYHILKLNDVECGYAIAINNADALKRYSHLFSDTDSMLFDEFQSETNHYCSSEIQKLISIHTSIARGQGKQVRYVPIYMVGNPVSIINPYYTDLGISHRLKADTHFLRGNGYVLEQGFNESASKAQVSSGFNTAFASNRYVSYSAESVYLDDSRAFIDSPSGVSRYMATLKYEGNNYSIREYADAGVLYVDRTYDPTFFLKITVTTADHDVNYVMLKRNSMFLNMLREYFERGCFRFRDLKCKEALLKALSY